MKTSILAFTFICVSGVLVLKAQDTVRVNVLGKNLITVVEDGDRSDDYCFLYLNYLSHH